MRLNFFIFLISTFSIISCTCDEGYCPASDDIDFSVEFTNDFRLRDLDTTTFSIYKTLDNSLIRTYQPFAGSTRADRIERIFYEFSPSQDDLREQYYIIKTAETTDTLSDFHFDINNTTYKCILGCFPSRSISQKDYAEISNFYFLHNQDTIWDNYVLIEK